MQRLPAGARQVEILPDASSFREQVEKATLRAGRGWAETAGCPTAFQKHVGIHHLSSEGPIVQGGLWR